MVADSNTGKYLRECCRGIRVLSKQEPGGLWLHSGTASLGNSHPTPETKRQEDAWILPLLPLCLQVFYPRCELFGAPLEDMTL